MQFIELSLRRLEEIERVFLEIFSREQWNDAWSGEQLRRYMLEIMGNDNSLSFGMEENGALVAIASSANPTPRPCHAGSTPSSARI